MNSKPYSLLSKYIVRTPILNSEVLVDISSERIKELCKEPIVSEAIFLASPELHAEMQKLLQDIDYENPRLELSLLKYLSRMSYRCTPFGLFAGISVGEFHNKTAIALEDVDQYKRTTRLDMNYLCSLVQQLENITEVRNKLSYFPNNSLYKIGSKYRYVEYSYNDSVRHHYTIAIDASLYIGKVLKLAEKGATIKDLVAAVVEPEISLTDAENFINNLIDNQILLSSISPTVSGEDYLDHIYQSTGISWLKDVKRLVGQLDKNVAQENLTPYQNIINVLEQLEVPFNKKFLFQTDLVATTASNRLDQTISNEIQKGVTVLNKLTSRVNNPRLESFKRAFTERYEDEEVPLAIALDVESGIGYDQNQKGYYDVCPLIDDLILSNNTTKVGESHYKYHLDMAGEMLYQKLKTAKSNNASEIVLTDNDLKNFEEHWNDLPTTFPVLCSIFEGDDKPTISLLDIGGSSASYLIGRFCHASLDVKDIIADIVQKEEKEESILAEIVHLPESRTGNILYRSPIRKYEIAYLAKSNLPAEQQIHISDLYISIKNETIFLRSKKLDQYIEPRMANAHNYDDTPVPIYKFLGDMQTQNVCNTLNFSWPQNLRNENFFPRVRYDNIIISLAQWRFEEKELKTLKDTDSLIEWQKKHKIPTVFLIADHDNELVVNLDNKISREMFLSEIKNKRIIILKENLYNEFDSIVKNGTKLFNNEFIFSLHQ